MTIFRKLDIIYCLYKCKNLYKNLQSIKNLCEKSFAKRTFKMKKHCYGIVNFSINIKHKTKHSTTLNYLIRTINYYLRCMTCPQNTRQYFIIIFNVWYVPVTVNWYSALTGGPKPLSAVQTYVPPSYRSKLII